MDNTPLDQVKSEAKAMTEENDMFSVNRSNYILLIIGIVIVISGFALMSGGGSEDPSIFSEEIFSTRRITIAPLTVLFGYLFIIYAIMKK